MVVTVQERRECARSAALYVSAVAISLVVVWQVYALASADWSLPAFGPYSGDLWFHSMLVKGMIDNGWYLANPFLGAPEGSSLLEFSYAPTIHMALMKAISVFSQRWVVVMNVYFMLTYPLTAVTALVTFRNFNVARAPALLASLLFTFLPYHFERGQAHLPYAAYYLTPLAGMVALWVWTQQWNRRRFLTAASICAAISFDLPYYSFFSALLIGTSGVHASLSSRKTRSVIPPLVLIGVILLASLANLTPTLLYIQAHGRNLSVLEREPAAAEVFGMKLVQLLLPIRGHRLAPFAEIKASYRVAAPLVNENDAASLGVVAATGFFLLLVLLIAPGLPWAREPLYAGLARLNVIAVLIATVGGFGALLAFTLLPQIRSYNRMSVFVAYFCLFAVALSLSRLPTRWLWPVSLTLLIVGLLDQIRANVAVPFDVVRVEMSSDQHFVDRIEASLPAGAMVFQLPYQPFPEAQSVVNMEDYSHLKGYLHSRRLRWSYASTKGRSLAKWQEESSQLPPDQLIKELTSSGFSGIYIDRFGYADRAANLEKDLTSLLEIRPILSQNHRLIFFPIPRSPTTQTPPEVNPPPIQVFWQGDCYEEERNEKRRWRWCGHEGRLVLANPSQRWRRVDLRMRLVSALEPVTEVSIRGLAIEAELKITPEGSPFHATVVVPPGTHLITLICRGRPAAVPNDSRIMVFSVDNFEAQ